MSKKHLWVILLMVLGLMLCACATTRTAETGLIRHTQSGMVRGMRDDAGTWCWRGIPYAQPPVDELRWKAPLPSLPWKDVLDTRVFGSSCAQKLFQGSPVIGSEDCLYLNIWRPRSSEENLPVYFVIHGGGNSTGSAGMADYNGARLAHSGNLIFVSVNYRLGPFGWFRHPDLNAAGDTLDQSGNYGLLDIICALRWVRDNITSFGGNPDNVTIAGQSAGGVNVLTLLLTREASGLFHRAVCESGVMMSSPAEAGDLRGIDVMRDLIIHEGAATDPETAQQIISGMESEEIAHYLRSRSPDEILSLYEVTPSGLRDFPFNFTDGVLVPHEGFEAFTRGTYPNRVPLIIGSNRDEFSLFFTFDTSHEKFESWKNRDAVAFGSLLWKADGVDEVARRLSQWSDQPPVYVYNFLWGSINSDGASVLPGRWGMILGSVHSLEIPFFFGNHDKGGDSLASPLFSRANRKGRQELSDLMMDYLTSFARSGSPEQANDTAPAWLPWTNEPDKAKCIVFDADKNHANIFMSGREYYADEIIEFYKRYMGSEVFESVMDAVFWR